MSNVNLGALPDLKEELTVQEKEYLSTILREKIDKGVSPTNDELINSIYNYVPVDIIEFIESSKFLNLGNSIYPRIKEILWYSDLTNIREVYTELGKSSGKSVLASIMMARSIYLLKAFRNPQRYHGLLDSTDIYTINVSISGKQAIKVVFAEFLGILSNSPFFNKMFIPDYKTGEVDFGKHIKAFSGHSQNTNFLGLALHTAVSDELNFMKRTRTSKADYGETIHGDLLGSLQTRFPEAYKLISISSANSENDFLTKYIDGILSEGNAKFVKFAVPKKEIDLKDETLKEVVLKGASEGKKFMDYYRETKTGMWMTDTELIVRAPTWALSEKIMFNSLLKRYRRNPIDAHKDYGNIVARAEESYFKDSKIVKKMANPLRKKPYNEKGQFFDWFRGDWRFKYCVHIDLSFRRDRTGLALGHRDRFHNKVVLDLMLSIPIPEGSDLDYAQMRTLIFSLVQRGFNIQMVSTDSYQSFNFRQDLNKAGINTVQLSVDRNLGPYDTFQELMFSGNLDYYYDEDMEKEVNNLILLDGKKVDHDPREPWSRKDLTDGVAGVCWTCSGGVKEFDAVIRPMPGALTSTTYRPGSHVGGIGFTTAPDSGQMPNSPGHSTRGTGVRVGRMPRPIVR